MLPRVLDMASHSVVVVVVVVPLLMPLASFLVIFVLVAKSATILDIWLYKATNVIIIAQVPSAHMAAFSSGAQPHSFDWFPDAGATHLTHANPYPGHDTLRVGNGNGLSISHVGSSTFHSPPPPIHLSNVLHVHGLTKSLVSVHQFCKDNSVFFEFHPSSFFVKDRATNKTLLCGQNKDGLYQFHPTMTSSSSLSAFSANCVSLDCWHC